MRLTRLRATQAIAGILTSPWLVATARAQTAATIRMAMIPIEPASLVYYASDNGFFAKAGIDVDIAQNPSTPALVAAVASGTYDIAYATISTLAVAHVRGLPFVVLAPGVGYAAGKFAGAIMVGTSSTAQTGKDLNGKTFATAGLNTIAEYLPRAWMDKHGGDSSTVKFVELPFPETPDALASGRVDAAYVVEPFVTIAQKKNAARILATGDDAIGPIYTATGWFATAQWAKAHPDLVTRFAAAMLEAARWANANPTKVVPTLVKELHADPVIVAAANRAYFVERLVAAQLQPWIDVTAKYAKFPSFPAAELIYSPGR
jgi:NitT/TauT family transport system substrate-binding protein